MASPGSYRSVTSSCRSSYYGSCISPSDTESMWTARDFGTSAGTLYWSVMDYEQDLEEDKDTIVHEDSGDDDRQSLLLDTQILHEDFKGPEEPVDTRPTLTQVHTRDLEDVHDQSRVPTLPPNRAPQQLSFKSLCRSPRFINLMVLSLLISCSIGVQLLLWYKETLDSWHLTFWRGALQIIIMLGVLAAQLKSPLNVNRTSRTSSNSVIKLRLKVIAHALFSFTSTLSMLYIYDKSLISSSDSATIYSSFPVVILFLELLLKRGPFTAVWSLVLLITSMASSLSLSHHFAARTLEEKKLQDAWPFFQCTDPVYSWPIHPPTRSQQMAIRSTPEGFSGAIGASVLSSLGLLLTTSCGSHVPVPVVVLWQGIGGFLAAVAGLLVERRPVLLPLSMSDWLVTAAVIILGLLANLAFVRLLLTPSSDNNDEVLAWRSCPSSPTTVTLLKTGPELLIVYFACSNFNAGQTLQYALQDGLGLALFVLGSLFTIFLRPLYPISTQH